VCPRDPESDGGGPGRFVGARVDAKGTEVLQDFGKNAKHELRSAMQRTRYEYMGIASSDPELGSKLAAKEPIELPVTKYYKDRLRDGAILPADKATAEVARLRAFTPASLLLNGRSKAPAKSPGLSAPPQADPHPSPDAKFSKSSKASKSPAKEHSK
jgi:hypothetical protein